MYVEPLETGCILETTSPAKPAYLKLFIMLSYNYAILTVAISAGYLLYFSYKVSSYYHIIARLLWCNER